LECLKQALLARLVMTLATAWQAVLATALVEQETANHHGSLRILLADQKDH
jgi:hypothetical protein